MQTTSAVRQQYSTQHNLHTEPLKSVCVLIVLDTMHGKYQVLRTGSAIDVKASLNLLAAVITTLYVRFVQQALVAHVTQA
jgi:hypothetical protein